MGARIAPLRIAMTNKEEAWLLLNADSFNRDGESVRPANRGEQANPTTHHMASLPPSVKSPIKRDKTGGCR